MHAGIPDDGREQIADDDPEMLAASSKLLS